MGERRWEQRFREREGREGWKVRRARENCRLECPDAELDKNAARNRWTTHRSGHRGASAAARAHEHSHEIRVHENCVKGRRTEEMGRRTARAHRPTIDSFFLAAGGGLRRGGGRRGAGASPGRGAAAPRRRGVPGAPAALAAAPPPVGSSGGPGLDVDRGPADRACAGGTTACSLCNSAMPPPSNQAAYGGVSDAKIE